MLPRNHPDRIRIVFDDHRLVANAGLLLPATLAGHLGLRELVDHHLDLGGAPGRANTGDKLMTLVASAMAGGDCIDDADVLRTGGTACTLGGTVKAPSTLGTFLRSFRWGHVRQLDRVSRELLARAWAAGAGPGDGPLTIDLDSTICETYGLAKEGARHHGYTGKRGYHPLLAIAAGTGDVLMSRLREGRANTARAASHCICHSAGLGKPSSIVPWPDCAPCHSLPDGGGGNRPPSGQPNVPANSRQSGLRVPLAASSPRYLALTNIRRRSQSLTAATEDRHRPPSTPNRARTIALPCPYRPFRCCIVIPSVDLGLVTRQMNRSSSHPPALTVLGKSPNPCQRGSRPSPRGARDLRLDSPAGQLKTGVTKDQTDGNLVIHARAGAARTRAGDGDMIAYIVRRTFAGSAHLACDLLRLLRHRPAPTGRPGGRIHRAPDRLGLEASRRDREKRDSSTVGPLPDSPPKIVGMAFVGLQQVWGVNRGVDGALRGVSERIGNG